MNKTKDSLGTRMKNNYEVRSRSYLPRRTNTILRIDGKSFHTYTRGLEKPFDDKLVEDMISTMKYLCKNIQGCKMGYVQSDEISLLLTDYDSLQTDAWFDGQIQKICSISASMATAHFNFLRNTVQLALFDSRVFSIPEKAEVGNYFRWRQQDAVKNSISMVAQANFSHKSLQGLNGNQMQEKLFQEKGINYNDVDPKYKRGTTCFKDEQGWNIHPVDFTGEDGWDFLMNQLPKEL